MILEQLLEDLKTFKPQLSTVVTLLATDYGKDQLQKTLEVYADKPGGLEFLQKHGFIEEVDGKWQVARGEFKIEDFVNSIEILKNNSEIQATIIATDNTAKQRAVTLAIIAMRKFPEKFIR